MLSLVPGVDRPQQVSFRRFEDQQWERLWLDRFKPMRFGRTLWIVPGDCVAPADAVHVLRLDPGLAFGTGTHPTTRMCLQWMDSHNFHSQTVVDYGCGSGVLGIVAAIKGATEVTCVDNDPQALVATRENAERNNMTDKIHLFDSLQFKPVQKDVVLANILAGPLINLAPLLLMCLRPGGSLVLSGILEQQADEVADIYRPHMDNLAITSDEGWICLHGQRMTTVSPQSGFLQ
jgi:ribosomal protein L11 methyltransferase